MKHHGCTLDFTHQRNCELMRAYRAEMRAAKRIVMPDIFRKVAETPCSRFWVSEERAAIVIAAMAAGKTPPGMRRNKTEMFREIYRRVAKLRKEKPETPMSQLTAEAVHQPAPKFYMTPRTAGELIYRIKNGLRRRNKETRH